MKVIRYNEDLRCSMPECKRTYFTVQINGEYLVDVMVSEECETAYIMLNEDGSEVYDIDGFTYEGFTYNQDEVIKVAVECFEKAYGRMPNFELAGVL